ncbi:NADPH-dependent 2,4-dienoyl-CoA reductase/sulfur reductase-like enzyme [Collimonas sp. PA-H2]|uniref:NAD(P)/FAD-dependent oxidoreductase n=1 Tax=Collimonas sp. PA-H2 TaxID=1881062 RepID=UPI000BF8FDB5|nr:FAD/NAD(P)-binding oxidoreductase [Collimonas sp. PA-H2]PFH10423.1 NADPH-dependent 2,4-dienoyl-CoA reductase/sulfur reductase-like enzyme [Collimonas sp. PA-H2]
MTHAKLDIVIVGAGPAGLAAARSAAQSGAAVALVDDNPRAGGQIWRGGPQHSAQPQAKELWDQLQQMANVQWYMQSRVLAQAGAMQLLLESPQQTFKLGYRKLILATGARERLLPFTGWTLPGVTGAGGLQALVKGAYPVLGKRIVVAGSGPLLLAVAATLQQHGAQVLHILEQSSWRKLAGFALQLTRTPAKLRQAWQLRSQLTGVPYHADSYVLQAQGEGQLRAVQMMVAGKILSVECDYLACGYGLLPNTELAQALGCSIADGAVRVDAQQRTSMQDVYCAGEGSGVGGVDLALAEGHIAGLHAAGSGAAERGWLAQRRIQQAFSRRLESAFSLRPELRRLCAPETLVCRCEDVAYGALQEHASWRSAKLHTRCGMGPCQGRVCGGATDFLFGWQPDSVRLPISPARVSSLIALANAAAAENPCSE